MIATARPFNEQQAFFKEHKIDTSHPGFYDHPAFLKLEQSYPEILNSYASFVEKQLYEESYLTKTSNKIKIITELLYQELLRDGRLGACVDMSMALSRILEVEKIWNYAVKGSLTIRFNKNLGLRDKYFYSLDTGNFVAGHAWVVAPPFKIIDLTLNRQASMGVEQKLIPKYILETNAVRELFDSKDLINPIIPLARHKSKANELVVIQNIFPSLKSSPDLFFPSAVTLNDVKFKYSPIGIGAPDLGLEELGGLKLNEKSAYQIYKDIIKPKLT